MMNFVKLCIYSVFLVLNQIGTIYLSFSEVSVF